MLLDKNELDKWRTLLHGVRFFESFEQDEVDQMIKAGEVHHYKADENIFREDDIDMSFCVVLRGSVRLFKKIRIDVEKELPPLKTGDCFGEMGLLLKDKRTASVQAAKECFLFKINDSHIETMPIQTKTHLYHRFAEFLAERLKATTESIMKPG